MGVIADKIYTDGRNISQMPVFDEQERIEYIRKDALLEWAKERLAECREQMERTDISERWRSIEEGYEKELCELIDKLNNF